MEVIVFKSQSQFFDQSSHRKIKTKKKLNVKLTKKYLKIGEYTNNILYKVLREAILFRMLKNTSKDWLCYL